MKLTQRRKKGNQRGDCVCWFWCVSACKAYSVVEGQERSVATLPCLLSCCSLGDEGTESVISSISSWVACDLVFFLLNACLKELRNCNKQMRECMLFLHSFNDRFTPGEIGESLCTVLSKGHSLFKGKRQKARL